MNQQQRLKLSRRQERDGMKRFGGVTNPRSGARWDRRNDGRTADELVEFKRTAKRTITLKFTDLRDLERHAITEGRYPVLSFELEGNRYVVLTERDYFDRVSAGSGVPIPPVPEQTGLVQPGEMPGVVRSLKPEPVLRRVPKQRTGTASQGRLSRHPSRLSRRVPGDERLSGVRPGEQREVWRLGRVLRTRTTADQKDSPS